MKPLSPRPTQVPQREGEALGGQRPLYIEGDGRADSPNRATASLRFPRDLREIDYANKSKLPETWLSREVIREEFLRKRLDSNESLQTTPT